MMIRTAGDIVLASNMSQDLTNWVTTYLLLWREHVNGYNDVIIPKEPFKISFLPMLKENTLTVGMYWVGTVANVIPTFYDVDDEMHDPSFGADNVSSYSTTYTSEHYNRVLDIPFTQLMKTEEHMRTYFVELAVKIKNDKDEAARLKRIAELETELSTLKGT